MTDHAETARNKAVFDAIFQNVFVDKNVQAADQYYIDDYIQHNADIARRAVEQGISQLQGMKNFFTEFFAALPDLKIDLEHVLAQDDKVVAILRWSATHTGSIHGEPPTGNRIDLSTAEVLRFEGGKVVEHWDVVDGVSLMVALGAATLNMPPFAAPPAAH